MAKWRCNGFWSSRSVSNGRGVMDEWWRGWQILHAGWRMMAEIGKITKTAERWWCKYTSVSQFSCARTHTHTFSINYILQTNRSVCRDELASLSSLLGSTWNSNFEPVALPHTSFALWGHITTPSRTSSMSRCQSMCQSLHRQPKLSTTSWMSQSTTLVMTGQHNSISFFFPGRKQSLVAGVNLLIVLGLGLSNILKLCNSSSLWSCFWHFDAFVVDGHISFWCQRDLLVDLYRSI